MLWISSGPVALRYLRRRLNAERTVGTDYSIHAIFSATATRHHLWIQHKLLSIFGSLKMGIMLSNYLRRCGVFFHPITNVKVIQCTNSIDFLRPYAPSCLPEYSMPYFFTSIQKYITWFVEHVTEF